MRQSATVSVTRGAPPDGSVPGTGGIHRIHRTHIGFIGFVGFVGYIGFIGFMGFIGFIGFTGFTGDAGAARRAAPGTRIRTSSLFPPKQPRTTQLRMPVGVRSTRSFT